MDLRQVIIGRHMEELQSRDLAAQLYQSWIDNASAWTQAVRNREIASRRLVTDNAILGAVTACRPRRVLDVGCGEGWLVRELNRRRIAAVGVDGSPPLIAAAQEKCEAPFHLLRYEEIVSDPTSAGLNYDVIVANFALLHDDLLPLLSALRSCLAPYGTLAIQTVHPFSISGSYQDGWHEENFCGFIGPSCWQPMPWYFRTIGSWFTLLRAARLDLIEINEPLHPETRQPVSLILTSRR
jgi:2-polyprenyl-3-methyl-5-hydroxy-6-metoxy-1,4-benzoquinol methylase